MKKLLVLAMGLIIAISGVFAQPKTSDKDLWKQAKRTAKELVKEGWKTNGSKSIEEYLFEHRIKLRENASNQELVSDVIGQTNVQTLNQAKRWAMINASTEYATSARQMVKGDITNELRAGIEDIKSVENFYAAYESVVATEIQGELKLSFCLYRENKEGRIECRLYYIINEDSASKARMRAMERAMQESEFARANAERISEFVRERVVIEK